MKITGMAKVLFVVFVVSIAIFGSLVVLDAMTMETFKDSALKLGAVCVIVIAASAVISMVDRK